jgi:broad specificity phosphatase PhoE
MIGRMQKEYRSLRRRPFLAPVWILGLLAVAVLAVAGWAVHAASTTVVVVMRHAEKAAGAGDDPPLSPEGVARAARIAATFAPGRAIDAIFVTTLRRTQETVRPLAGALGVPVITLPPNDLDGLERRIFGEYRGRRVLVVGHSDTVPELVRRLGDGADVPPIADGEYGRAYVIAVPRFSRPAVLPLTLP